MRRRFVRPAKRAVAAASSFAPDDLRHALVPEWTLSYLNLPVQQGWEKNRDVYYLRTIDRFEVNSTL